ncbi:MAG: hypothetical protein H7Y61_08375 [Rhizobiales bacterium]|nr:hypothetical protein [Rhizobacter sp.]
MRGRTSGSEKAEWVEISLEESGGFAGLHRGATLQRANLSAALVQRIDEALARLATKKPTRQQQQQAYPDAQTLVLRVRDTGGSWQRSFDTAELPAAARELLDMAPLEPLPPPE